MHAQESQVHDAKEAQEAATTAVVAADAAVDELDDNSTSMQRSCYLSRRKLAAAAARLARKRVKTTANVVHELAAQAEQRMDDLDQLGQELCELESQVGPLALFRTI